MATVTVVTTRIKVVTNNQTTATIPVTINRAVEVATVLLINSIKGITRTTRGMGIIIEDLQDLTGIITSLRRQIDTVGDN